MRVGVFTPLVSQYGLRDVLKKLKEKVSSLTGISGIVVNIDPTDSPELKPNATDDTN